MEAPGRELGSRAVGSAHRCDLVLGGRELLELARGGLAVRRFHQPLHAHLGLLRPAVRLNVRGGDHPMAAGAHRLPVPELPRRAAGLREERDVQADARAAGRHRGSGCPARAGILGNLASG